MTDRDSSLRLVSPVWLVLIGILSVQFGAGIAKGLFDEVAPTTLVWLRLATSAVVLMALARPALRGRTRSDWLVVLAFGASLGIMNWAIYQAFARIPLGVAVTLEFVGPLTLAVVGSRRLRDLLWVLLAGLGVAMLGFEGGSSLNVAGVLFALLAGAMWASYILLASSTGRRWPGFDGLALASLVAMLLLTPFAIGIGGGALTDPRILLARSRCGSAELGRPLQLRDGRAAHHRPGRLLDPDEPRTRRCRPCRDARAGRVPDLRAVGGARVCRRCVGRRYSVFSDVGSCA